MRLLPCRCSSLALLLAFAVHGPARAASSSGNDAAQDRTLQFPPASVLSGETQENSSDGLPVVELPADDPRSWAIIHSVEKANAKLRGAAEAGSAAAQYEWGEICLASAKSAEETATAITWWRRAAAQKYPPAAVRLGEFLRDGTSGVPQDYAEALHWFRVASDGGNADGMSDLADMLRGGMGTTIDRAAAAQLYRKAARKGNADAAAKLGWMYHEGETGQPDYAEARKWFTAAAERGNAGAECQLGLLYENGEGAGRNPRRAFDWMSRAAQHGDAWAQQHLGWMYHSGRGVASDDAKAAGWFERSANGGEPRGRASIGYFRLHGIYYPPDRARALDDLFAAARESEDPWIGATLTGAVATTPPDELPRVVDRFTAVMAEPGLMEIHGCLPEVCLAVMEAFRNQPERVTAAKDLLARMVECSRRQSLATLAWHAFLGFDLPFDLGKARGWARDYRWTNRELSEALLAEIDSVAGATASDRAAAQATLVRLAEAGDQAVAGILAGRYMQGIGCDVDLARAERYARLAVADAPSGTDLVDGMLAAIHAQEADLPPSPADFARLRAAAEAQRPADSLPAPLFRAHPPYPMDLKLAGVVGSAEVEFRVTEDGLPAEIAATSSSHPLFAAAAESAIKRWRFVPKRQQGQAVATMVVQRFSFNLN